VSFFGAQLEAANILTREWTSCSDLSLELLWAATDWHPAECLLDAYPSQSKPLVYQEISRLIHAGCLVVVGSPLAERDEQYETEWTWGPTAGLYHFGIKDPDYLAPEAAASWVMQRIATKPLVPMYETNEGFKTVVELPEPDLSSGVLATMRERRSERGFDPSPISIQALRDCLFAGFGIVGFLDAGIPGMDRFPLKLAPSGGGRNPYEGFVYARGVVDLSPGIYHYSAVENSLGLLDGGLLPEPCVTVGGQDWADEAAAVIFLVADFERVMWKYPHPTGYRVALIEAGHIGQNICLAAAQHGLVAVPTCAISDTLVEGLLESRKITQSVAYALVLGNRLPPDHQPPPDVRPFIRTHKSYLP
jgi:SagB-type dehydrogenase family enzyme